MFNVLNYLCENRKLNLSSYRHDVVSEGKTTTTCHDVLRATDTALNIALVYSCLAPTFNKLFVHCQKKTHMVATHLHSCTFYLFNSKVTSLRRIRLTENSVSSKQKTILSAYWRGHHSWSTPWGVGLSHRSIHINPTRASVNVYHSGYKKIKVYEYSNSQLLYYAFQKDLSL